MSPIKLKIPTTASKTEKCWYAIRSVTLKEVPLESALSYPVPTTYSGKLCFALFYYGIRRSGDYRDNRVAPPIAKVVATYPEARLVLFEHRKAVRIFPDIPASDDLGRAGPSEQMTPSEIMKNRQELFLLYDQIIDHYEGKIPNKDERKRFFDLFKKLTEPCLFKFYQALNPEFFKWLGQG